MPQSYYDRTIRVGDLEISPFRVGMGYRVGQQIYIKLTRPVWKETEI